MRFQEVVENEYKDVSGTVVDRVVSPKRDGRLEYEVMPQQSKYALGVHALRNSYEGKEAEVPSHLWYECDNQKIVRPLTFRENVLARVVDFETLKNKDGSTRTMKKRLRLFNTWLNSCTGIAYSSKAEDDFMIVPVCKELITLPKNFNQSYIQIDYASLQGRGFSLKRSQAKYNELLTESEVISHPGWIASVEEDIHLLCTYTSILFNHLFRTDKAMVSFLKTQIEKDHLRALFVNFSSNFSNANGDYDLGGVISLLRATPPSS